jgi:hypothetical protein
VAEAGHWESFAGENARALISMMAGSTTRSNQRPDTLMQDRHRQFDEIFLQRTAGPYKGVKSADGRLAASGAKRSVSFSTSNRLLAAAHRDSNSPPCQRTD